MGVMIRLEVREVGSNAVIRGDGMMEYTVVWHGMAWHGMDT